MNLYFLVEGKRTEAKVYPSWFEHLLPGHSRISRYDRVDSPCYFLISGFGYPSLLGHLENAFADVNRSGRYRYLVLCLDADEFSVEQRVQEIEEYVLERGLELEAGQLKIIVQNRCFETWFLGNRKVISRQPQDEQLAEFVRFYDVTEHDPELMGCHSQFDLHAKFHEAYLKRAFAEKNIKYSKKYPGRVAEKTFLDQLLVRIKEEPDHLQSFQSLVSFCNEVNQETS